ncbi:MAG TPA: zinc-binding dehydrogenase [Acidimicrobiales bacterium]|nr:zinc-binding dehydrogenase [Acidimicrobiales bacterium]
MRGVYLPGGRQVDIRTVPDPTPGPGQVVLAMRASTICGSDLRAIYREHLGEGPEAYQDVVAGHEPCGEVVAVGPDVEGRRVGDRVVVYHISGCGRCDDCRAGYQISCTSSRRRAYGWQRDGGHADYLLADDRDLLALPEGLTWLDGACVACGFGTAWEALGRVAAGGAEGLLVTGLGPVGLAAGLLARRLGAGPIIGADVSPTRRSAALEVGAVDAVVDSSGSSGSSGSVPEQVLTLTGGRGVEVAVDCSGAGAAQRDAVRSVRRWGRVGLVGEGAHLELDVSPEVIHRSLTLVGSWVTSTGHMADLLRRLAAWELHPEVVVTDRLGMGEADEAYRRADAGLGGKVGLVMA